LGPAFAIAMSFEGGNDSITVSGHHHVPGWASGLKVGSCKNVS